MTTNHDFYQLLDDLLDYIHKYQDQPPSDYQSINKIHDSSLAKDMGVTDVQFKQMLYKLQRDGYVGYEIGKEVTTVEGELFIQSGKYKQQQRDIQKQKDEAIALTKRTERNEFLIVIGTNGAALVAGLLLIYQTREHWVRLFDYCGCGL